MTKCFALFLSSLLLCAVLTASAEDKPVFPPLHSWTEIEDMTDKVIEWNVPVGKIETYLLLDPIPPLPEPGPVCKAPPELDSFADGTGIPVQLGIGKEPPKPGIDYLIGTRKTAENLSWEMVSKRVCAVKDRPKCRSASPAQGDAVFLTPEARKAFESRRREFWRVGGNDVICVGPGHFYVVLMQNDNHYGIRKTRSVYDLLLSADGAIKTKEISGLTDCDFIEAFQWREGCDKGGAAVFLDDKGGLRILNADGTVTGQPFCFKPTMGTDVWNPPRDFWGGTDAIAFPTLAVFERNYGIPRSSIVPLMIDPEGGFTRPEYRKWEIEAPLRPDVPRSRVVLQDLATGEVFLDHEGIFDLWPTGPSAFMYPMVASKGEWNFAVIGRKGFVRLIPYSCVFPEGEYYAESREEYVLSVSPGCISAVLRLAGLHRRILLNRKHDLATFRSIGEDSLGVSEAFEYQGKRVRQVWKYNIRKGVFEFTFTVQDVFQPDAGQCALGLYDGYTVVLHTGQKYGRISLRRAE
ncbi:MAG: hypothetical protein WC712_05790 [Candidatus Brocadiia bacterium]